MSDIIQKIELRKNMRKLIEVKLEELKNSHIVIEEIEKMAIATLQKMEDWKNATSIFSYMALKTEFRTDSVNRLCMEENKTLYLPCVRGDEMLFTKISSLDCDFKIGAFGIKEPMDFCRELPDLREKTLFIVPGLAFTKAGERLGKGKGYYDKFFAEWFKTHDRRKTTLVGLCYNFQVVDFIPCEATDMRMDFVISNL